MQTPLADSQAKTSTRGNIPGLPSRLSLPPRTLSALPPLSFTVVFLRILLLLRLESFVLSLFFCRCCSLLFLLHG